MDPGVRCCGMKANPTTVSIVEVCMLSDKSLAQYGLLENFNAKLLSFGYVLDFDLYSYPQYGPGGSMSWNES